MTEQPNGPLSIHFDLPPSLGDLLKELEKNFEKIEEAFQERRDICVQVHILPTENQP